MNSYLRISFLRKEENLLLLSCKRGMLKLFGLGEIVCLFNLVGSGLFFLLFSAGNMPWIFIFATLFISLKRKIT